MNPAVLLVRLEEQKKAITKGEIGKLAMVDHVCREKGYTLLDMTVEIDQSIVHINEQFVISRCYL